MHGVARRHGRPQPARLHPDRPSRAWTTCSRPTSRACSRPATFALARPSAIPQPSPRSVTTRPSACHAQLPSSNRCQRIAGFAIRQQGAGTRRVHQPERARPRAGTPDTPPRADLQDKRIRECPGDCKRGDETGTFWDWRARAGTRDVARHAWNVLETRVPDQSIEKFLQTGGRRCPRWRGADSLLD